MATITLAAIEKVYPNGHAAARGVDLRIADGEFLVLVGPSGCGKSTLLRLIAGLDLPTGGRIEIDGQDVTGLPPQERDVAMVFQSYALYPHMTVRRNLEYGLRVRKAPRGEIEARVARVSAALGLDALLERRPAQLSGGQRQRVALGRAMVREPKAFLLDEPLSNLDPALRSVARAELLQLHRSLRATIVYVTHDQEEALTLGTRVAVMRDGRIEQVGPPLDVYAAPVNTFVAQFIGSPAMNLLPASLLPLLSEDEPTALIDAAPAVHVIGVRPHDLALDRSGPLRATVDIVEPRGHDLLVHATLIGHGEGTIVAVAPPGAAVRPGLEVSVTAPLDRVHRFDQSNCRIGKV